MTQHGDPLDEVLDSLKNTTEVLQMMSYAFQGAQDFMDRAAYLRKDDSKITALWRQESTRVFALWRGKVAVSPLGAGLVWLASDHEIFVQSSTKIFLGMQGDTALFAADVSAWHPTENVSAEGGFFDANLQAHPDFPDGAGFADLRGVMTLLPALDADCAATAKALLTWHASHGFCANCGAASTACDAGWQRQCPACNAPHFPRTDPVVIMLVTRGDRLLLGRSPGWPDGMYSLLAGFVEPGETLESAVRREVWEETGVRIGAVRYLASQPWPFPANLMMGCIGYATSDQITLDPAELESALWLTRQEVLDVQLGRNPAVKSGRNGAIAQGLIEAWLSGRID